MTTLRTLALSTLIALVLPFVGACDEVVEVSNLPGHVTFVGPSTAHQAGVSSFFGVSDPEGDLISATFEVCDGSGQSCKVPEILPGSTSLKAVPASESADSAALRVNWRDCDLFRSDAAFRVRVGVTGSDIDALTSAPSKASELSLDLDQVCP